MSKILLVGNDFMLLRTRAAVLAKTGADVVPCTPSELATHLGTERFDMVVLCHTLGETIRREVTANAHRRWPESRILQVFSNPGQILPRECGADDMVTTDPQALIDHAIELLRPLPPRKPPQSITSPRGSIPAGLRGDSAHG